MKYCFGIDIGGTTIKTGLFTEKGGEVGFFSTPTRIGDNGAFIYDDAAASVRAMVSEYKISMNDVLGAGLTVPGPVYSDGRIGLADNLFIYGGYPAREVSTRLDGLKTAVINDANAAGLGELWMGSGKGCRSLCLVTLGTGVGGAVVEDGKVIVGRHGTGGEIGHICVEPEEKEQCNCGGYGCCEFYASATGIVRVAERMKKPGSRLAGFGDGLTAKTVCDLAKEGDENALEALRFSMDRLARVLASVALTTDPDMFVIGGGVSAAGSILTGMLCEGISKYVPLIREKDHKVVLAALGNRAGMYGAAKLVLDKER